MPDLRALQLKAVEMRLHITRMMEVGKPHHYGGSLSAADLVTALYFYKMHYDSANPKWEDRDRFLMSKGHCVPAQYAALAMAGFLNTAELSTLKQLGTRLQGHPAMHIAPGIEGCTGSLGHGLSYANGMALAARITDRPYRVYCLLGDGETQEGQVWEAAMTASRRCLSNLLAIIDCNGLKAMDSPSCAKSVEPMAERWRAFGWQVREIDGHDMAAICAGLDWAEGNSDRPSMLIAHTVKGKGVSFMEGQAAYHNAMLTPQQMAQAVGELEAQRRALEVNRG
ncbi:MAG: transketolase [Chloroflexi bacterium]|nr:transketolase [Chloroflexota bacterium]